MASNGTAQPLRNINPYYAASEKAVAAMRPFQARKKPMKHAAGMQNGAISEESPAIGQWMCGSRCQIQSDEPQHAIEAGKVIAVGSAPATNSLTTRSIGLSRRSASL